MSLLKSVQTGRKLKPLALMLHAPHGIGKSTFATEAPNPVFIGDEDNDELDVARFKVTRWVVTKKISDLGEIKKEEGLLNLLTSLLNEDHDYKTLVLDTLDGLERMATEQILDGTKYNSLNTYLGGYGKGTDELASMMYDLKANYIEKLRDEKGMNIVLLCHSKKVKDEEIMTGLSYVHYETALNAKVKPIFEDWVSAILFANYHLIKAENDDGEKFNANIDGERIIYTQEKPSHIAKNRFDMPDEIKFDKKGTWAVVRNLVLKHFKTAKKKAVAKKEEFNDEVADLKKAIEEKLPKLPADLKPHLEAKYKTLKTAGEAKKLLAKIEGALA